MTIVVVDNLNPEPSNVAEPSLVAEPSNVAEPSVASTPSMVRVSSAAVVPSGSGNLNYKNSLQVYIQRSGLPLPSYVSHNEGESHEPRFRATVLVDGLSITSPNTFLHRKKSEQDVAKIALEHIAVKSRIDGSRNIHKDTVFCKSILKEYGDKLKLGIPKYNTSQQIEICPTFISTVTFDGKTHVGFAGKNRKEAEQNAACVAIDSILASSNAGNEMAQIIKTKSKFYAAIGSNATAVWESAIGSNNVNDVSKGVVSTHVVGSHDIISKKKRKRSAKQQQQDQSKSVKVNEQASTLTNPLKSEQEDC